MNNLTKLIYYKQKGNLKAELTTYTYKRVVKNGLSSVYQLIRSYSTTKDDFTYENLSTDLVPFLKLTYDLGRDEFGKNIRADWGMNYQLLTDDHMPEFLDMLNAIEAAVLDPEAFVLDPATNKYTVSDKYVNTVWSSNNSSNSAVSARLYVINEQYNEHNTQNIQETSTPGVALNLACGNGYSCLLKIREFRAFVCRIRGINFDQFIDFATMLKVLDDKANTNTNTAQKQTQPQNNSYGNQNRNYGNTGNSYKNNGAFNTSGSFNIYGQQRQQYQPQQQQQPANNQYASAPTQINNQYASAPMAQQPKTYTTQAMPAPRSTVIQTQQAQPTQQQFSSGAFPIPNVYGTTQTQAPVKTTTVATTETVVKTADAAVIPGLQTPNVSNNPTQDIDTVEFDTDITGLDIDEM